MSLPAWQGKAAASWEAFIPRETARTGKAPGAFNRAASAMLRYQAAFASARAEIEAAISDAAKAEQSTSTARQHHHEATLKAAAAEPGTPEAIVAPFKDPGATRLADAQTRAETALASFTRTGDEVAGEIRSAAGQTSDEQPGIEWWDQILQFTGQFVQGMLLQGWDTVVGVWDMLPIKYMFDDWFGGGKPWWEQYFGDLWGGIIDSVVQDPWGAVKATWDGLIAADHWGGYAGEGTGRVTTNILLLLGGGAGIAKVLKGLKGLDGLGEARTLAALRAAEALEKVPGVSVSGEKVLVNGVSKMTTSEWAAIREASVHNVDAPNVTLGKWDSADISNSYTSKAQAAGNEYFDLGADWDAIAGKYGLSDDDMFDLFNRPFLDDVIADGKTIHFTDNPANDLRTLGFEYEYLRSHGYKLNLETMTAKKGRQ
jgi:hypothetical protein